MISKKILFFILLIINNLILIAQESDHITNDLVTEDLICTLRFLDKNRISAQSRITSYDALPGTFWVVEEPYVIDGNRYYFQGYIFLSNNCLLEVAIIDNFDIDYFYALNVMPILNISFIKSAMTYTIDDGKIIVEDEFERYIECYLEETYLYFNQNGEFKKYRLESTFSTYP